MVQYFPDLDYLLAVLTAAVKTVKQGSVFLGDIRNLRLLEAFHASVGAIKCATHDDRR